MMEAFIKSAQIMEGGAWSWVIPFVVSFLVTVVIAPVLIPWLKKLKFGQEILEIGPSWHKSKSGTPTMGGMMFIAGVMIAGIVTLCVHFEIKLLMQMLISLGFGVIGFVDDYIKVVKKRNLGFTAKQKFLLQTILAVIYVAVLNRTGDLDNTMIIPFCKTAITVPWWLYIVLILFVVTGTVNAVNLTDGIDGLAASITSAVSVFFILASIIFASKASFWFSSALCGGCLAFLIFNAHPAKVFMGDTGSLFLGGCLSIMAVELRCPLILIIVGFVYMFETISVIMQVTSFKLRKKRIFKMTPIHHHFEMCGWKENKIVGVFTGVTVALCIVGIVALIPYFMANV